MAERLGGHVVIGDGCGKTSPHDEHAFSMGLGSVAWCAGVKAPERERWLDQTILADPDHPEVMGNCWQTCIASIFGLPLDEVPHFVQLHESMDAVEAATREWARGRGFDMIEVYPMQLLVSRALVMLHGRSPRGIAHVVVGSGLEMIHDPHPSKDGLRSVAGAFVFVPLDPAERLAS